MLLNGEITNTHAFGFEGKSFAKQNRKNEWAESQQHHGLQSANPTLRFALMLSIIVGK